MFDAQLGPGFVIFNIGLNLVNAMKTACFELLFLRLDFAASQLHDVNDAQVNAPHFRRIIVNESNNSLLPTAFDQDLFF
jgi:hypothetical protein